MDRSLTVTVAPVTTTGRHRGEYAKSAGRRLEILDASMQVFSESGFRGGSIRDIAGRVGISQAGLLHHFPSKNELLESVLTHRDDQALERMGGDPLGATLPRGLELIRALVELISFNATTPGLVALYAVVSAEATATDHPAHEYFRTRYTFVCGVIREAFELAQGRGEIRSDVDCAAAARTLVAISDGLQVQWLYDFAELDMADDARNYVDSLLAATSAAKPITEAGELA